MGELEAFSVLDPSKPPQESEGYITYVNDQLDLLYKVQRSSCFDVFRYHSDKCFPILLCLPVYCGYEGQQKGTICDQLWKN